MFVVAISIEHVEIKHDSVINILRICGTQGHVDVVNAGNSS